MNKAYDEHVDTYPALLKVAHPATFGVVSKQSSMAVSGVNLTLCFTGVSPASLTRMINIPVVHATVESIMT